MREIAGVVRKIELDLSRYVKVRILRRCFFFLHVVKNLLQ